MNQVDWIGFIGVFQILLAYILNLKGKADTKSLLFLMLNFLGATMACVASILLDYLPFVILEGVWAFVSLASILKRLVP